MFAIVRDGEIVKTGSSIRSLFPSISFSSGRPSATWMQENGVMEIVEGEQKDQRFYWVTPANPPIQLINGLPTRVYINTPRSLEDVDEGAGLKSQWISIFKDTANRELAETDWYVVRKMERGVDIPEKIKAKRLQIIEKTEAKEAAIAAASNIEDFIAIVTGE